ncbi:MAG: glutaredoxin 3 [Zoogloeaceae bacterium]|jgi:glutaredoxin 3|nr:glutaredoxin 3 [Zoogloeaceae bacterium]
MNRVRMYTTAICPYCIRAKKLLNLRGAREIDEIRVDLRPEEMQRMTRETGRRTVPQIYIGDIHIGGCDELYALDLAGKLTPLLVGTDA